MTQIVKVTQRRNKEYEKGDKINKGFVIIHTKFDKKNSFIIYVLDKK